MEQTVISTTVKFVSKTKSPFLPESDRPNISRVGYESIPFIDMKRDDTELIIQQMQDAFQEYGFFQVGKSLSISSNKQVINVALTHPIDLVLRLGDEHYWIRSTKPLTPSDVNNQARLLWPNEIFPTTMSQDLVEQCRTVEGHRFEVEDIDTRTSYMMTLKQWNSGSYILTTFWTRDFVRRRSLKVNDVIGLLWDTTNSKFYFSVRKRG